MYESVPSTSPTRVIAVAPGGAASITSFATPKSSTFTMSRIALVDWRRMFPGFTSRWMIPARCAAARPERSWMPMNAARAGSMRPEASSTSLSVVPSSISITRKGGSPALCWKSVTCTRFGCPSAAADSASRRNRTSSSSRAVRSSRMVFSATRSPSATCGAS